MRIHERRARVNQDRWLISYADFITLLFALFVVLYAVAKADEKKQFQITESIDNAFKSLGLFPNAARDSKAASANSGKEQAAFPMNIVMGEDVLSPAQVRNDLDHIRKELTQTLSDQVAQHTVSIQMGRDGLVISLKEAGFFAPGSATPRAESMTALAKIAAAIGQTPYDLRVEGHTDNTPIHTVQFESNWELSSARATGIARLFLDHHVIPPDRISASGFAEFHPVAANTTPEGRAQNRRVDLVVLPRTHINLANLPQSSAPTGQWHKITDDDPSPQK